MHSSQQKLIVLLTILSLGSPLLASTGFTAQADLQCQLSATQPQTDSEPSTDIRIALHNISDRALTVLWPADPLFLLRLGTLSFAIEDETGMSYRYMPDPGPYIPPLRHDFVSLPPGRSIDNHLSVCRFRDQHAHDSPCSKAGHYTIRATYVNLRAENWDDEAKEDVITPDGWTGQVSCSPILMDISQK